MVLHKNIEDFHLPLVSTQHSWQSELMREMKTIIWIQSLGKKNT